mmetsp:Transcript_21784/g.43931  ORF Transcript_21784/g.43931 Transcript_21784/m.43931 type:complete len:287 (+) Transcript_21784:150-1010(+)
MEPQGRRQGWLTGEVDALEIVPDPRHELRQLGTGAVVPVVPTQPQEHLSDSLRPGSVTGGAFVQPGAPIVVEVLGSTMKASDEGVHRGWEQELAAPPPVLLVGQSLLNRRRDADTHGPAPHAQHSLVVERRVRGMRRRTPHLGNGLAGVLLQARIRLAHNRVLADQGAAALNHRPQSRGDAQPKVPPGLHAWNASGNRNGHDIRRLGERSADGSPCLGRCTDRRHAALELLDVPFAVVRHRGVDTSPKPRKAANLVDSTPKCLEVPPQMAPRLRRRIAVLLLRGQH